MTPREQTLAREVSVTSLKLRLFSVKVGPRKDHTILGFADLVFAGVVKVRGFILRRNPEGKILLDPPCKVFRAPCHECGKPHEVVNRFCPHCGTVTRDDHRPEGRTRSDLVKNLAPGSYDAMTSLVYAAYVNALETRAVEFWVDYPEPAFMEAS